MIKNSSIGIIFPHQLFEQNIVISKCDTIYLVEEHLFFRQYNFHKQKIAFHRASIKFYESFLISKNIKVVYIDSFNELNDVRNLIKFLHSIGENNIEYIDTTDYLLERRMEKACKCYSIHLNKNRSPLFLNTPEELATYFAEKRRMFQTDFYKQQRISRNILLEKDKKPLKNRVRDQVSVINCTSHYFTRTE